MSYFENIVNKWSHKVKSGMPDVNNFGHKLVLRQVLLEEGWDIRSANTLIDSLVESEASEEDENGDDKRDAYAGKSKGGKSQYYYWDEDAGVIRKRIKDGSADKNNPLPFATKDQIDRAPKDDKDDDKDEEESTDEMNKNLNQDIDFNNPPKSVKKDIEPDDDTFNKQEEITPQEYDPDQIEVGEVTIDLPITEDVLREQVFPTPPYKFPDKYIKTLVRVMNTQKIDRDNPPITSFTNSSVERETVGAGQISAQTSELLMMMSSTLSDKESDKLFEILEKTSDVSQGKQILDKDWIQSSRAMREASLKNIREQHGPDAIVEFGGWDSKADVEDGIGLKPYKNKGFSTDTFFRVKVGNKSVITEVSNKKNLVVHLANPGSGDIERQMEKSGVDIGDESRQAGKFTENAAVRSRKRISELSDEDMEMYERMDNMSDEELLAHLQNLPHEMRANFTSGIGKKMKLKSDARKFLKMVIALKDVPKPWDPNSKVFLDDAKAAGVNLGSRAGGSSKSINKMMIYSAYLQYADELSRGEKDGRGMNFIHNQVGIIGKEPYPEGSQRDVENQHIVNLNKKESRPVLLKLIRDKFPLKSLLSGEESMVLGSNRLSPEVCQSIFGTTDWDKIQENITIKKNSKGEYYLTYTVKVDGKENEIKIAQIKPRGKGKGYAGITTEMSLAEEFQHTIHCANKTSENPPVQMTDVEIKLAKKLERKYGECEK